MTNKNLAAGTKESKPAAQHYTVFLAKGKGGGCQIECNGDAERLLFRKMANYECYAEDCPTADSPAGGWCDSLGDALDSANACWPSNHPVVIHPSHVLELRRLWEQRVHIHHADQCEVDRWHVMFANPRY